MQEEEAAMAKSELAELDAIAQAEFGKVGEHCMLHCTGQNTKIYLVCQRTFYSKFGLSPKLVIEVLPGNFFYHIYLNLSFI